ncbi:O-antigen polymerase [Bacillus mobilis]|uniref:O-antigen polymerase n=1 Tax=Bacillus mobilis TaxID=2026190 RepID=UPI0021D36216|nr:O-antigen polymerase [Bacillus mobilis]MCU5198150.1 oligosaccharide repeat unit polymerase [Bacillus mobilis]
MNLKNQKTEFKEIWWLKPYLLTLFCLVPMYIFMYFFNINKSFNYFKGMYFFVGLIYLLWFSIVSCISNRTSITTKIRKKSDLQVNLICLDILAILTMLAYCIWFFPVIVNKDLLVMLLTGNGGVDGVKYLISTIPGITTLSQLGVVYVTLYVFCLYNKQALSKRFKFYFFVITVMTIFRVVAWSERLALIEFVLPIVIYCISFHKISSIFWKKLINFIPYIGLVAVIILFGITEYFRSWSYYMHMYSSYSEFVIERFFNYYYLALNNGAGILSFYQWPTYDFSNIASWVYKFPIIGDYFFDVSLISDYKADFLRYHGNEEFTNSSGLFMIMQDIGVLGGLIYTTILGILAGFWYRSFRNGNGIGILLYPLIYLNMLEFLRILYIADSRAFPIILFSCIVYIFFIKRKESSVS